MVNKHFERLKTNGNIVKRFCEGAGITLAEFFDRDYFNDIEEWNIFMSFNKALNLLQKYGI